MELYELSKLKKFMNVVKFMMEDSLRFLIETSLETYANFLEVSSASRVTITSVSNVKLTKTLDKKKFPLFMIDLAVLDNKIVYTTNIKLFEDRLSLLFKQ